MSDYRTGDIQSLMDETIADDQGNEQLVDDILNKFCAPIVQVAPAHRHTIGKSFNKFGNRIAHSLFSMAK